MASLIGVLCIRYVSGREEKFEVELFGGSGMELRLQEFLKDPTLVLQVKDELLIIPSSAVECLTFKAPEEHRDQLQLSSARRARRVK
jgi:hypothetical protein